MTSGGDGHVSGDAIVSLADTPRCRGIVAQNNFAPPYLRYQH
mgnify:CR=1 FL=1